MHTQLIIRKSVIIPLVAAVMAFGAAGLRAQTFVFDTFFSGDAGAPVTPGTFATLTVTPSGGGLNYHFDLDVSPTFNTVFGASAIVDAIQMNTNARDPTLSAISAGSWGVAHVRLDTMTNMAGGVSWDFTNSFCLSSSGNCHPNLGMGGGPNPSGVLVGGESVEWDLTFASPVPVFDNPSFLLRIQRIGPDAVFSAQYTPPIPEPEIYAMLVAGLGLMGFVARRRRQQAA
jgi:hypothetical protein